MENLQRRPNGVYVARLTVPARLRQLIGKRELISSTGTHNLVIAKLVASARLAQWRRQLFDLDRLALAGTTSMNHDSVLKIADGHPFLRGGGHLPLNMAAGALGLKASDVLRMGPDGPLSIFFRAAGTRGCLVPLDALETDFPTPGARVIPSRAFMPAGAVDFVADGLLRVPLDSLSSVSAQMIAAGECVVVLFEVPGGSGERAFAPDQPVTLTFENAEVAADQVERLRQGLAAGQSPELLAAAREAQRQTPQLTPSPAGKNAHRRFSEALAVYAAKFLPQKISSRSEIERVRSGIGLFMEFEGDLPLGEIDVDRLRAFRDERLSQLVARENQVRVRFKTRCMAESIKAVEGLDWPRMSAAERDLRMQWIARMFRWLKEQKWIAEDPTTALRGESVESKAQRKVTALTRRPRLPFADHHLVLIFSEPWFRTGTGKQTNLGTFREFSPFHYWLPILGLYTGARINELCQLWLDDVGQTEAGTWYLDMNENTADKSLKRQKDSSICWSKRRVPIHPDVVALGFDAWCDRMRQEGFKRVFPDLSWNEKTHYAKEPIRFMSALFSRLGMPRDNTLVFHSFRHTFNNALARLTCSPELRKRLMGHEPGAGVNEQHYLDAFTPEEGLVVVKQLPYKLPTIAQFDIEAGVSAVRDSLRRKGRGRGENEALGPAAAV